MSEAPVAPARPPIPRIIWPICAMVALLTFNAIWTPGFFHLGLRDGRLTGSLVDVLSNGSIIVMLAVGMTLVIATRGIDLSVGAVMAIAAAAAAVLTTSAGAPGWAAILAGLGLGVVAGLWNGALVAFVGIQPIVATLILMVAGRGAAQLLTKGQIVTFSDPVLVAIDSATVYGVPLPIVLAAGLVTAVALFARRTGFALMVESTGQSESAARLAGVPVASIRLWCYGLCGLCAAFAGLLAASDIRAADANNVGLYLELDAILAVVLGGTALAGGKFSIAGSVVGAIFIQTLTTTLLMQSINPSAMLAVKAAAVLVVCLMLSSRFRLLIRRCCGTFWRRMPQ